MQIKTLDNTDATAYRDLRLRALHENPDAFTSSFEEENKRPLESTVQRLTATTEQLWGHSTAPT